MAAASSHSAVGRTILVVDDERFSRLVLVRMLGNIGWSDVVEAANGREALDQIARLGEDLAVVISDFNMPEMNGLELLQSIRVGAAGPRRDLPVIMLTGRADRGLVGLAMGLDCDAFLIKPTMAAQMQERLARVLSEDHPIRSAADYAAAAAPVHQPRAASASGVLIALEDAKEGMVLAADLVGMGGDVLLAAGSALTRKFLTGLADLTAAEPGMGRLLVKE